MITLILCLLIAPPDAVVGLDARLREVARIERAGVDSPDASQIPGLIPLLGERDLRLRGLAALAISRHVSAVGAKAPEGLVGALLAGLGDDNPHVVGLSGRSLLALGPRALPDVGEWLRPDLPRAARKRRLALEACRLIGRVPAAQAEVERLLWRSLQDEDASIVGRAFYLLTDLRTVARRPAFGDVPLIRAALASPNEAIRELAAGQLLALDEQAERQLLTLDEAGIPVIVPLLGSQNAEERRRALVALEKLYKNRREPSYPESAALAKALAQAKTPQEVALQKWLEPLARMQAPPTAETIRAVDAALRSESPTWPAAPETARVLMDRLHSGSLGTQRTVSAYLRENYRDIPVTRALLEAVALGIYHPDKKVADDCGRTLYWMLRLQSSPRPVPPLVLDALAVGVRDAEYYERDTCSWALVLCGPPAEAVLPGLLRDRDDQTRYYALEALIELTERHGTALLRMTEIVRAMMVDDPNPKVRRLAHDAHTRLLASIRKEKP